MICTAIMACGIFLFHAGDHVPVYAWSQFPLFTTKESYCHGDLTFASGGLAVKDKSGAWTFTTVGDGVRFEGTAIKCLIDLNFNIEALNGVPLSVGIKEPKK